MTHKPLRDYQKELVSKCSKHYLDNVLGVLMQSTTGSGKTRTAAYIVEKYTTTQRQVLWIVHREELLMQASLVFAEMGIEHQLICASNSASAIKVQQVRELGKCLIKPRANLIIASIMTIVRRLGSIPWVNPAQIVADECHLSMAETWQKVIRFWPKARLLGLTATPTRLDGRAFAREQGGMYDRLIIGPHVHELIELGFLAKFKVYAPPIQLNEIKLRTKGGDYLSKDLAVEIEGPKIYGDVIAHYKKYSHGKPAIGFCPTVESAQKYADVFQAAGYNAVSLDGSTDDNVRRNALRKLGRGEIDVIFSVSILIEGTDVPYATTAIWLRKTLSTVIWLQGNGRVLRPHPDKEHAIILDFVGNTQIHGLPDEVREWSLSGDVKRKNQGLGSKDIPKIKNCPKCFSIHDPSPKCPECGHIYTAKPKKKPTLVDVDLIELTPEIKAEMDEKKSKRVEVGMAKSLTDLLVIEKQRGYRPGWAKHVFSSRGNRAA